MDRVLDQLLAHGHVRQGYLGIAAQPVRATLDGVALDGLLVSEVAEDGPAARAGVLVSDVIVKVSGEPAGSRRVMVVTGRPIADALEGQFERRNAVARFECRGTRKEAT